MVALPWSANKGANPHREIYDDSGRAIYLTEEMLYAVQGTMSPFVVYGLYVVLPALSKSPVELGKFGPETTF